MWTDGNWPGLVFCCVGRAGTPPRDSVCTSIPPKSCVLCRMTFELDWSIRRTVDDPFLWSNSVCHWPSDKTTSPTILSTFPATPASDTYWRSPFFNWERETRWMHSIQFNSHSIQLLFVYYFRQKAWWCVAAFLQSEQIHISSVPNSGLTKQIKMYFNDELLLFCLFSPLSSSQCILGLPSQ